jgi:hypothetical protein
MGEQIMVSRLALLFVLHIIVLGVWLARRKQTEGLGSWWKPWVYLLGFYLIWGVLISQRNFLIMPG